MRDELQQLTGRQLPELSMGMTADADAAVAEGATLVRIGTAIFGPRFG
jgi:PLP dependent protein